ncbi:hypothetical protein H4J02_11270 [Protaetiibacter sp. SSC-01]|uniref:hypothetical protein n=1 Tax=Protaetiibacter sp. SSC-01 TaxID=2759943 RepID=UPI001656DB93|nr:hypothetical protein [Protaetiibacter sp. SSC-01]QNO37033.1 hypothetical protein H4J02_11270 [Protaetiibacter sp. SSC-01]
MPHPTPVAEGTRAPAASVYYYAREATRRLLESSTPRVYLYGSYEGYNNFGDILQLKNTIAFHRADGRFEVVAMVALESVIDADYTLALERWLGVEHVLYTSFDAMDASLMGLEAVSRVARGGAMHLYGGGHLNAMWGARHVRIIRDLIETVGVENYLLSGIQLDADILPELCSIFSVLPPGLIGLRDHPSLELVRGTPFADAARFSFDDTIETMKPWADALAAVRSAKPTAFALHLNTTAEYTASREQHDQARNLVGQVQAARPDHDVVVLHAYDDVREVIRDSLPSLKGFDAFFPFDSYAVADLARMALQLAPGEVRGRGAFDVEFGITSSYHTALFLTLQGVPTRIISLNDYYRQKSTIFGPAVDLELFLADPRAHVRDFGPELAAREAWIDEARALVATWDDTPRSRRVSLEAARPVTRRPRRRPWRKVVVEPLWQFTGRQ